MAHIRVLEIVVRRDHLVQESLLHFNNTNVLQAAIKIKYNGEIGYDAGKPASSMNLDAIYFLERWSEERLVH